MATYEDWLRMKVEAPELSGGSRPSFLKTKQQGDIERMARQQFPGGSLVMGQRQTPPGVLGWSGLSASPRNVPLMEPNAGPPEWLKQFGKQPEVPQEELTGIGPVANFDLPKEEAPSPGGMTPAGFTPPPTPAGFTPPPTPAQYVPSLRDRLNEGIMQDWENGIDRGLPFIGGENGRYIQSIAQQAPLGPMTPVNVTEGGLAPHVQEFAKNIAPMASQLGASLGVDPRILIAKFGLETNWGRSVIPGTNNYGNIKAGGGWTGPTTSAVDNQTRTTDKYRAYQSPEEFGSDYARLLSAAYPGATGVGGDVSRFADGLLHGKYRYAEDKDYKGKLISTFNALANGATLGAPTDAPMMRANADGMQVSQSDAVSPNGPLRQPVEIIRGLQRTAFDPLHQQEFVMAPPGTPPQLAMLSTLAQRGMLPPGAIQQVIGEQGRITQEGMQQAGGIERQKIAGQSARDVATIQADAQGDDIKRATGRALASLIQGKEPVEQLRIISSVARGDKDRFQVVTMPDVEVPTGNSLDPIKIRKGGQFIRDNQTGEWFAPPQPKLDRATILREAQGTLSRGGITGPRREAFIAQLRADGLDDKDLTSLGLLKK